MSSNKKLSVVDALALTLLIMAYFAIPEKTPSSRHERGIDGGIFVFIGAVVVIALAAWRLGYVF